MLDKKIESYENEINNYKSYVFYQKERLKEHIIEFKQQRKNLNIEIENKQKDIDKLTENIRHLSEKMTELPDYKKYVVDKFLKVWNSEIKLINASNSVEEKLNRLAYLWNVREIFKWTIKYVSNKQKEEMSWTK